MMDNELRQMFVEREVLIPDPARVSTRIAASIAGRRNRARAVRLVLAATAVVGVVAAAAILLPERRDVMPNPPGGVDVSPGPARTTSARVVAAPEVTPTIAVTFGWLPPDLGTPIIFTNLQDGIPDGVNQRTLTYERDRSTGSASGTESVTVSTYSGDPTSGRPAGADDGVPGWVTQHDSTTVDINGHPAEQARMSSKSVGSRSCSLFWRQRPDLWIWVTVQEKTTNTELTCEDGLRVARDLREKPQKLKRTVGLTEVPAGFQLRQTGTNLEVWCPPAASSGALECLSAQSGRGYATAPGQPVTVQGHPGTLERTGAGFSLVVPGWLKLWSGASDLTDVEILQVAETAAISN